MNKETLQLIAAAKEEHVGIIRARVNDQLSSALPGSSIKVEQFTAAIIAYVNQLAGGTLIHPLYSEAGPQIANLDESGTHFPLICLWRVARVMTLLAFLTHCSVNLGREAYEDLVPALIQEYALHLIVVDVINDTGFVSLYSCSACTPVYQYLRAASKLELW